MFIFMYICVCMCVRGVCVADQQDGVSGGASQRPQVLCPSAALPGHGHHVPRQKGVYALSYSHIPCAMACFWAS